MLKFVLVTEIACDIIKWFAQLKFRLKLWLLTSFKILTNGFLTKPGATFAPFLPCAWPEIARLLVERLQLTFWNQGYIPQNWHIGSPWSARVGLLLPVFLVKMQDVHLIILLG